MEGKLSLLSQELNNKQPALDLFKRAVDKAYPHGESEFLLIVTIFLIEAVQSQSVGQLFKSFPHQSHSSCALPFSLPIGTEWIDRCLVLLSLSVPSGDLGHRTSCWLRIEPSRSIAHLRRISIGHPL